MLCKIHFFCQATRIVGNSVPYKCATYELYMTEDKELKNMSYGGEGEKVGVCRVLLASNATVAPYILGITSILGRENSPD